MFKHLQYLHGYFSKLEQPSDKAWGTTMECCMDDLLENVSLQSVVFIVLMTRGKTTHQIAVITGTSNRTGHKITQLNKRADLPLLTQTGQKKMQNNSS